MRRSRVPDKDGHRTHWTSPGAPWKKDLDWQVAGRPAAKKVYISGPMRGIPYFNFPLFDEVKDYFLNLGWTVFSPADHDRELGHDGLSSGDERDVAELLGAPKGTLADQRAFARWDLDRILEADLVVLLPGWTQSVGATAEHAVAKWVRVPTTTWILIQEFGYAAIGQAFSG